MPVMVGADTPRDSNARPAGFWPGCLSGFSTAAALVLLWFAHHFAEARAIYRDFRGEVPAVSQLVTHPVYLRLVPALVFLLVVAGNLWLRPPRRLLVFLMVTTALAFAAVVIGYWAAMLPFTQLAGTISAD